MERSFPITIIVPAFRHADDLRACVESIFVHSVHQSVHAELLIINDASPDDELVSFLDHFALQRHPMKTSVLHNETNLGFVRTMNRGLLASNGDVVMLNADTIVTDGWLDRLSTLAQGRDVATVTPLTNSGSFCSLPPSITEAFGLDGTHPQIDQCAAFVRSTSLNIYPEVLTGVGFCMYVTREAVERVGILDEHSFGQGYGEEVDFCLRSSSVGMRHLVDDSTFVFHRGERSFGSSAGIRKESASAVLDDRYPTFVATNLRERRDDPLRVVFAALELGLQHRNVSRSHILHVLHNAPENDGGTEEFVRALCDSTSGDFDISICFPVANGIAIRSRWGPGPSEQTSEVEYLLPGGPREVVNDFDSSIGSAFSLLLDLFDFDAVHIHSLFGFSLAPLASLRSFTGSVCVSIHDMFLACPNFSLLYRGVETCGIPQDRDVCVDCLAEISSKPVPGSPRIPQFDITFLERFRRIVKEHLDIVDHWIFPSQSAIDTFLRVYEVPEERIHLIEHGSVIATSGRVRSPNRQAILHEKLKVAFVGLGWQKKGLGTVNQVADLLADEAIDIHHFGTLKEPASSRLITHGSYINHQLPDLLVATGIQVALLPGPYAETFGLVMTEILVAGIPIIGTQYGALGERIRTHSIGWTVDPFDVEEIAQLIRNLNRCRPEILRAAQRVVDLQLSTVAETSFRYRALYQGLAESLS